MMLCFCSLGFLFAGYNVWLRGKASILFYVSYQFIEIIVFIHVIKIVCRITLFDIHFRTKHCISLRNVSWMQVYRRSACSLAWALVSSSNSRQETIVIHRFLLLHILSRIKTNALVDDTSFSLFHKVTSKVFVDLGRWRSTVWYIRILIIF